MSDPTPSCLNCPSFLAADEVDKHFHKSIGAPMCLRFGKVLGGPGMAPVAENKLQETIASKCDGFGKAKPKGPPEYLQTEVALPDSKSLADLADEPSTEDDQLMVGSCLSCKFYIPDRDVMNELDWASGMCAAKGRLIIPGMQSKEAGKCEVKKQGRWSAWRDDLEGISIIPMYEEAREYDPSPLGQWKAARRAGVEVDPREYETDAEVTDEDAEFGIRAWRRVDDPSGSGNHTFMPIFDPDHFEEMDRARIPQAGDPEHPEDYIDSKDYVYSVMVEWMELDQTPALWGPPGAGKTELARHISWLMQIPFDRMSFTSEMEVEELIGKMMYSPDKGTYFQQGRLPRAWVKPRILLMDEPNTAQPAVWQRVRPLTDNSKQLVLDEAGSEIVERHPFCFLVMAMNPSWDVRNTGTFEIAAPDISRLSHVFMDLPTRAVEYEVLKTACEKDGWEPSKTILEGVLDNSDEIRALVEDGSLPVSWGVRENLKVIRHLKWFTPEVAYRRAVVDVLDPQTQEMVMNIVTTGGRL